MQSSVRSLHLSSVCIALSCASGTTSRTNDVAQCDDCGGNDWPNLIVGVPPQLGIHRVFIRELGIEAIEGGCPGEFDFSRMLCTWSVSIPGANDVTIAAQDAGGRVIEVVVDIHKPDCARNIAYLEIQATDSGTSQWTDVSYINPCIKHSL